MEAKPWLVIEIMALSRKSVLLLGGVVGASCMPPGMYQRACQPPVSCSPPPHTFLPLHPLSLPPPPPPPPPQSPLSEFCSPNPTICSCRTGKPTFSAAIFPVLESTLAFCLPGLPPLAPDFTIPILTLFTVLLTLFTILLLSSCWLNYPHSDFVYCPPFWLCLLSPFWIHCPHLTVHSSLFDFAVPILTLFIVPLLTSPLPSPSGSSLTTCCTTLPLSFSGLFLKDITSPPPCACYLTPDFSQSPSRLFTIRLV